MQFRGIETSGLLSFSRRGVRHGVKRWCQKDIGTKESWDSKPPTPSYQAETRLVSQAVWLAVCTNDSEALRISLDSDYVLPGHVIGGFEHFDIVPSLQLCWRRAASEALDRSRGHRLEGRRFHLWQGP